jgi:hypothetical protein
MGQGQSVNLHWRELIVELDHRDIGWLKLVAVCCVVIPVQWLRTLVSPQWDNLSLYYLQIVVMLNPSPDSGPDNTSTEQLSMTKSFWKMPDKSRTWKQWAAVYHYRKVGKDDRGARIKTDRNVFMLRDEKLSSEMINIWVQLREKAVRILQWSPRLLVTKTKQANMVSHIHFRSIKWVCTWMGWDHQLSWDLQPTKLPARKWSFWI